MHGVPLNACACASMMVIILSFSTSPFFASLQLFWPLCHSTKESLHALMLALLAEHWDDSSKRRTFARTCAENVASAKHVVRVGHEAGVVVVLLIVPLVAGRHYDLAPPAQ